MGLFLTVKGNAISSSVYKDQSSKYSPRFAIDGLWVTRSYNIYTSKREKLPWLQWHLPNQTLIFGVSLSDEYGISPFDNKTHKDGLINIEVRAGISSLSASYKGKITINKLCARVEVRGGEDRVYPIVCENSILADYITVQVIDDNAILQINELEIIENSEGIRKA